MFTRSAFFVGCGVGVAVRVGVMVGDGVIIGCRVTLATAWLTWTLFIALAPVLLHCG